MSVSQRYDGRYAVYYRDETGRQRTKYFGKGATGKRQAEIFNAEVTLKKKQGAPVVYNKEVYLDDLAQMYLEDCKARGIKVKYRRETANLFNNHLVPLLGRSQVSKLRHIDIIVAVNQKWSSASQTTRNRYMDILKAVFSFGVNHELLDRNPLARWRKQKERPRELRLTFEDLVKIKNCAKEHLKWAIVVAWNLGCRPGYSELTSIKWSDVNLDRGDYGEVCIRGTKTITSIRTVPINEHFRKELVARQHSAKCEYLIEYKGQQMKKFRRSFKSACLKAGITYNVRMYDIRHLYATELIRMKSDVAAVSSMMGHASNRQTLEQYYHLVSEEKQKSVNKLRPM